MYSERMHNFRLESGRSFEPEHDAVIYHDEIIKSSKLNHPKTKSTIKNNLSVTPQIIIKQNNDSQQSATIQKCSKSTLMSYEKAKWSNKKIRKLAGFGNPIPYENKLNR